MAASRGTAGRRVSVDYETLFQSVLSPLLVLDPDFRVLTANHAYCEIAGVPLEGLMGGNVFELFPDAPDRDSQGPTQLRQSLEQAAATAQADTMTLQRYDVQDPSTGGFVERYWSITSVPVLADDGSVVALIVHPEEVTNFIGDRRPDDAQLVGSAGKAPVTTAFTASMGRLRGLNEFAQALVAADTIDEVGRAWLRYGLQLAGAGGGSLLLLNGGKWRIMTSAAIDADTVETWQEFSVNPGAEPFSDVLATGEPMLFEDPQRFLAAYPQLADTVAAGGHRAWAVVPLSFEGRVMGAAGAVYDEPNSFDTPLRVTLHTIGSLLNQAVSRARLLSEQTSALRSMQSAVLGPYIDPAIDSISASGLYRPATAVALAGGDWYDAIVLDEDRVLLMIGDVANHGPVAAGELARARTIIHALAIEFDSVDHLMTRAARTLSKLAPTMVTCCAAVFDRRTSELTWSNAGHLYPLVSPRRGDPYYLRSAHGPPLGFNLSNQYGRDALTLEHGDTVVFYTDGLIERRGESIDVGFERLAQTVAAYRSGPTDQPGLPQHVYEALHPKGQHTDDVAILAITLGPVR